jgi:hypothetical protein
MDEWYRLHIRSKFIIPLNIVVDLRPDFPVVSVEVCPNVEKETEGSKMLRLWSKEPRPKYWAPESVLVSGNICAWLTGAGSYAGETPRAAAKGILPDPFPPPESMGGRGETGEADWESLFWACAWTIAPQSSRTTDRARIVSRSFMDGLLTGRRPCRPAPV